MYRGAIELVDSLRQANDLDDTTPAERLVNAIKARTAADALYKTLKRYIPPSCPVPGHSGALLTK